MNKVLAGSLTAILLPAGIGVALLAAPAGIVAFAITYLLVVGEIDLSAGAMYTLCGVLAAKLYGAMGLVPAMLIAVAAATALGTLNGILVAYLRINSFVATLAARSRSAARWCARVTSSSGTATAWSC